MVYVFTYSDGWSEKAQLDADFGGFGPAFGGATALSDDGSTALCAAPSDDNENGNQAGSAWIYTESDDWSQDAKLIAENGDTDNQFGSSVALSSDGTTALLGSPGASLDPDGGNPDGDSAGAAYVFTESDEWSQEYRLTADDGDADDSFGEGVALSDDGGTAVVGAWNDEDLNGSEDYETSAAGSAYVFTDSDGWSQQAKLSADDGDAEDNFGRVVMLTDDGGTALVGADGDDDPNGDDAGSVYVFTESDGWSQTAKLAADDGSKNDVFGGSVAASNGADISLIGAVGDDEPDGDWTGATYVFTRVGGWSQQAKLSADDAEAGDYFGAYVTVSGDGSRAVIGAPFRTTEDGEEAGTVYVFSL